MVLFNLNKGNEDSSSDSKSGFFFGGGKSQKVNATIIEKGNLSSSVVVTGAVEEINKKDIISTSSVKILGVLAEEGDVVNVGDTLFTIDLSTLEDELIQLRLNKEIQTLQLEKIQSVSSTSSSSSAKIALELAKLSLASAQKAYDTQAESLAKSEILFEEGIISQSELDSMTQSMEGLLQQVDVAKLNVERSESDLSQLYVANNTSSTSLEYDVQIQLKNLESLDINIGKVEKQMLEVQQITIAPIKGMVTKVYIEVGDITMGTSPLLQIVDMTELIIKANVREYDIRDMEIGQAVVITGDAIPKDAEVTGKLSYIAPVASDAMVNGRQTTGIEIHMSITNGLKLLKPGYTTDCEITTESLEGVIVGSYDLFRDESDTVFVVVDGVLEERTIEKGTVSDFEVEIVSGLNEGDIVVTNPSLALKDGMKVTISNELMSDDLEEEGE